MQHLVNILHLASIYSLVALSFALMYEVTKFFNLAHGALISLSGYFVFLFFKQLGIDFGLAILLSLFSVTLLGAIIYLGLFKVLLKKQVESLSYLTSSLGIYIVLASAISIIWGNRTISIQIDSLSTILNFNETSLAAYQVVTILLSTFIFLLTIFFLRKSRIGNQIKCISLNKEISTTFGIESSKIQLITFAIASLVGGIGGVLYGYGADLTPWMGFQILLYGIISMIIGGIGSKVGLLVSSLGIASLQYAGAYFIESKWMEGIAFTCLLIFLIFRPLGLSGRKLKKVEI